VEDGKDLDLGYGLFALKDIKAGDIISDYQGEVFRTKEEGMDAEYATQNADAKYLRGYLAFSSDGAPNGALIGLTKTKGLAVSEVLVALHDIKAGEQILWDYGTHDIKWDVYKELDKESPTAFFRKNKLSRILEQLAGVQIQTVDQLYNLSMFSYVVATLPVLLRLSVVESLISKEDIELLNQIQYGGNFAYYGESLSTFLNTFSHLPIYPTLADFIKTKSKEGNVQVLAAFLTLLPQYKDALIKSKHIESDLEEYWISFWGLFCTQNKGLTEWGACPNLERIKAVSKHDEL
jgi:hypothetical protein